MIWKRCTDTSPVIPSPEKYGWTVERDIWVPVMTTILPAPQAVLNLVKCSCGKSGCKTGHCKCHKAELPCTDMCGCDVEYPCENMKSPDVEEDILDVDEVDTEEEDDFDE